MRNRGTTPEHQEAATRRLALLSAQLEAERTHLGTELVPAAGEDWWEPHTRVPGGAAGPAGPAGPALHLVPDAPGPPSPEPGLGGAALPVPGRHAARRAAAPGARREELTDLVPETLRGRVRLGPAQLAVVALLVAVGAVVTACAVIRDDPAAPVAAAALEGGETTAPPLADSLVPAEAPAPADPGGTPPVADTGAATSVTVDVAGKVRRPGIVVLDAGARVVDALEEAGGARPGVDLIGLNLARLLVDGEQIVVGVDAVAPPVGAVPPTSTVPSVPGVPGVPSVPGVAGALVDLNLATQAELEELPEVGPVTATAIITWREQNGGFTAVAELLEVDGIGDKTLAQLTPLVTV